MGKPSDLLILKTVSLEPKHGWAIAKRIQQISAEVLHAQQGSPCPALHRLRTTRLDQGQAERNRDGRQAKFYPLTAAGRAQLDKEAANSSRLAGAINLVVVTALDGDAMVWARRFWLRLQTLVRGDLNA